MLIFNIIFYKEGVPEGVKPLGMQGVGIEPPATDSDFYYFGVKIPLSGLDVLFDFKKYVIDKYGKQRGYMGKELINALSFFLEHNSRNERIFKSKHEQTKLIKYAQLLKQYKEITLKDLRKLISQHFGSDDRTIRKYINLALTHDFISLKLDKGLNNRIYAVNEGHIRRFLGEKYYEDKKQIKKEISKKIKELKNELSQTNSDDEELKELRMLLSAEVIE